MELLPSPVVIVAHNHPVQHPHQYSATPTPGLRKLRFAGSQHRTKLYYLSKTCSAKTLSPLCKFPKSLSLPQVCRIEAMVVSDVTSTPHCHKIGPLYSPTLDVQIPNRRDLLQGIPQTTLRILTFCTESTDLRTHPLDPSLQVSFAPRCVLLTSLATTLNSSPSVNHTPHE